MAFFDDGVEVEALVTDRYLEALLSTARGATAGDAAFGWEGGDLDRGVRLASLRLRRDLPRFHPSFRFEERLAVRLAEAAATRRLARAAGAEGAPTRLVTRVPSGGADDVDLGALLGGPLPDPASSFGEGLLDPPDALALRRHARPILIGGAVASAAVSLAGAAFVAWRRGHQPRSAMARAARAAHAAARGTRRVAWRAD